MNDLWERVKKTATEIYATASERTVEGVNVGVKRLDLATLRRDLSREFAALGGRVYQLLQKNEGDTVASDPVVARHMARLRELEEKLEEREREIRSIRQEGPTGGERARS